MPRPQPTLVAKGNIYPCRFVKLDASNDFGGLQAGANEKPIGITLDGTNLPAVSGLITATYHAVSGEVIRMLGEGDVGLLELGGTVVNGDRLKSDANGKGVAIAATGTTIQNVGARALQGGDSGHKILVQVEFYSERPALS